MFDITTLFQSLLMIAAWIETTDGTNAIFALICFAALMGAGTRFCVAVTLALHMLLILI